MSRHVPRLQVMLAMAVAFLQVGTAFAAIPTAAEDSASRTRIRNERQRANAEYASREAACKQRFVVASCLNDAAVARRNTLERLQEEEAVLNERQRAVRADIVAQRVADKKAAMRKTAAEKEAAARDAASKPGATAREPSPSSAAGDPARADAVPSGSGADAAAAGKLRKPPTPSERRPVVSHLPSAAQRDKSRAAYERRLQDAAEHRREVEARNAANAAKKKPAAALPAPDEP